MSCTELEHTPRKHYVQSMNSMRTMFMLDLQ